MKVVYVETINEELPEKSWGAGSKEDWEKSIFLWGIQIG